MRFTFRAKLLLIVGAAALAFVVTIVVSQIIGNRVQHQLTTIQERYVPKVEFGPELEARFERLRRGFQDAVAAHDTDTLDGMRELRNAFLDRLAAGRHLMDPGDAVALRDAVEEYYATAFGVSQRMLAGEAGEGIVDAIARMQMQQTRAEGLIKKAALFDRRELAATFAAANEAESAGARTRLIVSAACLGFVLLLSLWLSRDVLRSLAALGSGLARFGKGEFGEPIRVVGHDELAEVAEHANRMAKNLDKLQAEREAADWLKTGQAGLTQELRGELQPGEVATRALSYLAHYLGAPAGALYAFDPDRVLRLLGRYALGPGEAEADARPSFSGGEGLVGQAALQEELVLVKDPPPDYLRVRSGLGESAPRAIALLPLVRDGKAIGVLELALFTPWSNRQGELLISVRESVAIAIEVARARATTRSLLAQAQNQALLLTAQEDRLRISNDELQAQHEELKQTNEELTQQAEELEMQQQTLEKKNAELFRARQHLEEKAKELTAVSAYKSQFLANMSHELRTPLNSMLLLSNLLAENEARNLDAKQVRFAKTIHSAGKDLLALINQVLDLAKVEAGKQEVRIEQVRLSQIAEHAEHVFGALAREKRLNFVVEIAPGLPDAIATDRQRLGQILNNLLGNAFKFTDHGQVALRIDRPGPDVRFGRDDLRAERTIAFAVSDTGMGIAPEHQERIFAPFEQVEAASDRRHGGTGLGLSIARELAALLGGELSLTSVRGEGATFVCHIPDATSAAAREALSIAPHLVEDDRNSLGPGDAFLLVVEDDPLYADMFGQIIRAQGMKFVACGDGHAALRFAKERRPSGIILDIRLPGIDGWKIMEELRADPKTADIPVHFVSALDSAERGMAMGAVGYVTKPATRRDLVRVVESLTPLSADRTCRILVVEDETSVGESVMKQLADEKIDARRVTSARQAMEVLKKERFACMILDLSLPDMDGLEFLQSLQEQRGGDTPQVIVYTARALNKPEAKRLEAYAEAVVLREGSSAERLLDVIRLFVRRLQEGLGPKARPVPRLLPVDVRLEGKKILVADDDMRTVYALSATLRAKGIEVVTADTGRAALDVLAEHSDVAAVLMDVMMPEMDGYEATRRIRANPRFKGLYIITLTAKAMKGDREKCLEAGASDYLPKPVDADLLLTMLNARLSGGSSDDA